MVGTIGVPVSFDGIIGIQTSTRCMVNTGFPLEGNTFRGPALVHRISTWNCAGKIGQPLGVVCTTGFPLGVVGKIVVPLGVVGNTEFPLRVIGTR
jgi:hypothetical protein